MITQLKRALVAFGFFIGSTVLAQAATIDYKTVPTGTMSSYSQGGVTVTGSADLYFLKLNGIGVVGSSGYNSDNTVGNNEWLQLAFDVPVSNVSYRIAMQGYSSSLGEKARIVRGYLNGVLVGDYIQEGAGPFDLSSMFGNGVIDTLFLGAVPSTTFRLGSISFEIANVSAVPLPAAVPLFAAGMGILGLMGWRRKRAA